MSEGCQLLLDKDIYYPGEEITAKVKCSFKTEVKVRGIYVKLQGQARTSWQNFEDSFTDSETEKYLDEQIDLIKGNHTVINPGNHTYSFSFVLPYNIPSNMKTSYGHINYSAKAVVDLIWKMNFVDKKEITIGEYLDLNTFAHLKQPVVKTEEKILRFCNGKPITLIVKLPVSGFVASQVLDVNVHIRNLSNSTVSELKFAIFQVFQYRAHRAKKRQEICLLNPAAVENSIVLPQKKQTWNVKLQLPSDMSVPNLEGCNIIKTFCELRAMVSLPFPHFDIKMSIPFSLGHVPLESTVTHLTEAPVNLQQNISYSY